MFFLIFPKLTGNYQCRILLFVKVASLRPTALLKKRPRYRCFLLFCKEHLHCLLLEWFQSFRSLTPKFQDAFCFHKINDQNIPESLTVWHTQNTKISPNFLMWKFCGNAKFGYSFIYSLFLILFIWYNTDKNNMQSKNRSSDGVLPKNSPNF